MAQRVLAVVATTHEQAALLRDVTGEAVTIGPRGDVVRTSAADVLVCGIGPAAAAAATADALARTDYGLCLSVGIAGAFPGTAAVGDVVVATELVAADLGADSPTGFLDTGALGWHEPVARVDAALVQQVLDRVGPARTGPVLTVSTVTGTGARAQLLAERHGATAEAMEGWGVWEAARAHGLPVLEVRAVSNLVGDRDPASWDLPAAFDALARVGAALLEGPWR